HAQRCGDRPVGCRKGGHHCIAAGLYHRPGLSGNDVVEDLEMRSDEIEGGQIAYSLIEFGGTSDVGKKERQAGDLEALVDIDHVGAVEIAKYLVGQQPLCAQERFAPAQKLIEP